MEQNGKKWKLLSGSNKASSDLQLPTWLLGVLSNRGIKTKKEIAEFLHPEYEGLWSPNIFLGMEKAVKRIARAKETNEQVTVYGDYDVDGICSTALIYEVLNKIGVQKTDTYIPHREDEGYGLNNEAIEEIAKTGTTLLVAVDCGITAREQVAYANEKGIDVIVCDHHEIDKKLLPAAIIIHPQMVKKGVATESMSACGVAFYLARALQEKFSKEFPAGQEKWLLDLVVLATVCDVVPLVGQNRILAKYGLLVIEKSKRPGIRALLETAGIKSDEVNSYAVGFLLGPRLNAAGRLDHAKKALELLLTQDEKKAATIAYELSKLNRERQVMCDRILAEAKAEIEGSKKKEHEVYLLSNRNWPRGVVGIIASKLSDAYTRPVIVFEDDGETMHGSARSIENFNIIEAISHCSEHLVKFGGHAKAAGLTVKSDKFVLFSERLLEIAKKGIREEDLRPEIIIDAEITEEEISDETVELISSLEPFGYGNHNPTFMVKGAEIEAPKKVGSSGEHLKFVLKKSGLSAIFFSSTMNVSEKHRYDLALTLRYNFWNQRKSIEARVIDMKESNA